MDLRSTILGLLSWQPFSGYDLKRIISQSDIFYWSGNNNQIYKSLIELQKSGLVNYEVQVQEGLPAKKVYSITEKGRQELRRSLLSTPELPDLRKGFLIQLAWADPLTDAEVLELLEQYEADIANLLQMHQAQARKPEERPERSPRERYLWERIMANITSTYQSELEWVRQTKQEIAGGSYRQKE
ncbi:MAG: PadR family transcriptional regulator [Chloroflexi bacterium]|jgi:DNA-binding PadR family transcriptional regulator|nr:PadR family transcriptional regulator [Chloroflexota bacterium]